MWGLKEGLSRPLGPNASMRLRLNSVLNSCTRRGSFTGNSLGVLGACLLAWPYRPRLFGICSCGSFDADHFCF